MSVICLHCCPQRGRTGRPRRDTPKNVGKSRVMETRTVKVRIRNRNAITIVRIRQCIKCRWRWKTKEYIA